MDDDEKLLKLFEISQKHYHFFHNALWEHEKHFTWWISILIASIFVIFMSDNLGFYLKNILVISVSILGLLVSFIGYNVIRKEGVYFKEGQESFNRISKALKINEEQWNLDSTGKKYSLIKNFPDPINFKSFDDEANENRANKPIIELLKCKNLGVRDYFQLIFIIFFVFFIFLIIHGFMKILLFVVAVMIRSVVMVTGI